MAKKPKDEKYTDPELKEKLKEKIRAGGRSGKPGQWSARKAQLLVREYEKADGGYTDEERDPEQKSLEDWTDEDWQTADGKVAIRDGETARYLPREAWEKMSPKERRETDRKKREASKQGEHYVSNTAEANEARKEAREGDEPVKGYDGMNVGEVREELGGLSGGELKKARAYEEEHMDRKILLEWLDRKIGNHSWSSPRPDAGNVSLSSASEQDHRSRGAGPQNCPRPSTHVRTARSGKR